MAAPLNNALNKDALNLIFTELDERSLNAATSTCRAWRIAGHPRKLVVQIQRMANLFGGMDSFMALPTFSQCRDFCESSFSAARIAGSIPATMIRIERTHFKFFGETPDHFSSYLVFLHERERCSIYDTVHADNPDFRGSLATPQDGLYSRFVQAWLQRLISGQECHGLANDYSTESDLLISFKVK